jgi:hypothetical protein
MFDGAAASLPFSGFLLLKPLGQLEALPWTIKDFLERTLGVAPVKPLGQLGAVSWTIKDFLGATLGVAPVKPLGQLGAVSWTIKDFLGATLGVAPVKHLQQLEAVPQQHGVLLPQSLLWQSSRLAWNNRCSDLILLGGAIHGLQEEFPGMRRHFGAGSELY